MDELALPQIESSIQTSDADFKSIAKSKGFLPRVQVQTQTSGLCIKNGFPVGHIALISTADKFSDLGKQVDMLPLCYRFHAIQFVNNEPLRDSYNKSDSIFQEIIAICDSGVKDNGCLYGPEFLVWLPDQKQFATVPFFSASAKPESQGMKDCLDSKTVATMRSKLNKNKKNQSWWGPQIISSTTPLTSIPTQEELVEQMTRYLNPKPIETKEKAEGVRNR